MYSINKRGLKIDPYGTPYGFILEEDMYFLSVVLFPLVWVSEMYCMHCDRYDLNHNFK